MAKRKRERKCSILQPESNRPETDSQATHAMLGAAIDRKDAGRSCAGKEALQGRRWYNVTNTTT